MAVTAQQRARACFLGFLSLAVGTVPASWVAAQGRPNDQESAETGTTLGSSAAKGAPASESGASYFSEAAKLIRAGSYITNRLGLYDALARGAVELLEAKADPKESIEGQPVVADLRSDLGSLGLPDTATPNIATIHVGSNSRASEDILLFSFEHVPSSIVAIHRIGEKYDVLPPTVLGGGAGGASIRTLDVTGDGVNEAIATYEEGGSAGELEVEVLRWVGARDDFRPIFSMEASSWMGLPCRYRFVPARHGQNIEVTLPVVGTFDDRGPYQAEIALWTYDAAADRFVKRSDAIEPPTTTRQQLNAAESLLRRGKLSDAVHAYHRAWIDTSLKEQEESEVPSAGLRFPGADFRGFARFREGELLALLGGEREARVALDDAETRGGVLGMLAAAFLANYAGPDGAVRAWAGLPDIRNLGPTNEEPATSNIYGQPPDILYLGQPLASYLTTHPDAAEHPDAVFETMRSWGLETSVATAADLDGDGTNEFLFETPKDGARRLWVVYRKNGRWLVDDSFHRRVEFGGIVALPKGNAIKMIYEHTGSSAPESALTWRDGKVMFVRLPSLELSLPGSMQSKMLPWPNCLASLPH